MNDDFCPLPFLQLELRPDGEVAPCCFLPTVSVGNLTRDSLANVWNGERLRKLRREFLEGHPKTCARQMRHRKCHEEYAALRKLVDKVEWQTRSPRRLDVRLNGRCNLKCVMCDVWKGPNGVYETTDFWQRGPREWFRDLVEIDVLGGEPFVQRDTFRLISSVSSVNSDCTWGFVSNGQWRFKGLIESTLDRIPLRYFQISLDSLSESTYSQIRLGGGLARVLENVSLLAQYRDAREKEGRGFELRVSLCVQRQNWEEVPKFLAFTKAHGLKADFQFLYYPPHLSLGCLPHSERSRILERWKEALGESINFASSVVIPLQESLAVKRPKSQGGLALVP